MRTKFLAPMLTVGVLASGNASSGVITAVDVGTLGVDEGSFTLLGTSLTASSEVPYFNIADSYLLAWKVVVERVGLSGTLGVLATDETSQAAAIWSAQLTTTELLPVGGFVDFGTCTDSGGSDCNVSLEYSTPQEITGFDLIDVVGAGSYKVNADAFLQFLSLTNVVSSFSLTELIVAARSEYTYCVSDEFINCAEVYGDSAVYVPGEESRVPVPATAALLALGLAGLRWGRRQPHSS